MSFWEPENLRAITVGRWLRRPTERGGHVEPTGVSTDSRTLRGGQVFIALRGERFDGHDYLDEAAGAGARLVIVDREAVPEPEGRAGVLLVDDTLGAMARLATAYRRTLSATVIAITGSVGKTTTKQMVDAILSPHMPGAASARSFNNHIGVPLTLLNASPRDRYLVVEAGTNAPGEIDFLARIIQPDVAVITAIGLAHVEKLGGREGIAAEKSALLRRLRDGGLAIVTGDAPELEPYLKLAPRLIRFGEAERCDLRLTAVEDEAGRVRFEVNGRRWFELPCPGAHNAWNALAAVGVGRHMKLDDDAIAEGLGRYEPPPMRLNARRIGGPAGVTLINDAYNANPTSMAAAIETLESMARASGGRAVAVLGEMAELGERSPELHRALGERLAGSGVDTAVLIGRDALYAAEALGRAWAGSRIRPIAAWTEGTAEEVATMLRAGDTVLIKASRSAALERLVPAIEARFARPGGGASDGAAAGPEPRGGPEPEPDVEVDPSPARGDEANQGKPDRTPR